MHKLFTSCIRRCLVSRACDWVMSALSAALLTVLQISSKSVHCRRSHSRMREHRFLPCRLFPWFTRSYASLRVNNMISAFSFLHHCMADNFSGEQDLLYNTRLFHSFVGRMPYVEATILEVMRYKTIVPFSVHATLEDTSVGGYFVPRGTSVWSLP